MALREDGDHGGRGREQEALEADERRCSDGAGDGSGEEAARQVAGDRRSRADREEPACLADIERRRRHGPADRRRDGTGGHDRQPGDRHDVGNGGQQKEFGHQQDADGDQRDPEEAGFRDTPEGRSVGERDDQREDAEGDVEPRKRIGGQAAEDERVDADLTEPATGLQGSERERDEPDPPDLVLADIRGATESAGDRSGAWTPCHRGWRVPDETGCARRVPGDVRAGSTKDGRMGDTRRDQQRAARGPPRRSSERGQGDDAPAR